MSTKTIAITNDAGISNGSDKFSSNVNALNPYKSGSPHDGYEMLANTKTGVTMAQLRALAVKSGVDPEWYLGPLGVLATTRVEKTRIGKLGTLTVAYVNGKRHNGTLRASDCAPTDLVRFALARRVSDAEIIAVARNTDFTVVRGSQRFADGSERNPLNGRPIDAPAPRVKTSSNAPAKPATIKRPEPPAKRAVSTRKRAVTASRESVVTNVIASTPEPSDGRGIFDPPLVTA